VPANTGAPPRMLGSLWTTEAGFSTLFSTVRAVVGATSAARLVERAGPRPFTQGEDTGTCMRGSPLPESGHGPPDHA
jgi:hypothetical protein